MKTGDPDMIDVLKDIAALDCEVETLFIYSEDNIAPPEELLSNRTVS